MAPSTKQNKLVLGFWMDHHEGINIQRSVPPNNPVGAVANTIAGLVINKLNSNFKLDPPLVLDDDMTVTYVPHVLANDDISTLDDKGLITLVYPSEETSLRVKNRLEEIKSKANEQDSVAKLREELMRQIGPMTKKIDLQEKEIGQLKTLNASMGKEIGQLKTLNASMKTLNATMKTDVGFLSKKAELQEEDIVQLKASNMELKASDMAMKASNKQLSETVTKHDGVIGSIWRRMVLNEARKKLINKYPNQAAFNFNSESLSNSVTLLHNALSDEDLKLLSLDALRVIFDSSYNSIRYQGNVAAHEAKQADLAFSVLSADVKETQRRLLKEIYSYVYSQEPEFLVPLEARGGSL